ncbi:MAG: enolase [Cenarchaeum sp. SB0661_bin_35]|nr:enolase [Cenarchaeum sp. SB0667_bin_13]MXY37901.1 enolase [Cenarchaeum sp. SB0664_bin_35]MXZ93997.1 enolase [Cenarchaeum sp. SB0666_bin_15]MYB46212.1 enolase [Cenarchaeum sp. SB0662_bin_33]MYC79105.1 enolase [Cenarchaeum sp. SB0661_bin_35]MYD58219.1 enolase [Cenarchaeum sp. SB0678_bin_8]MYI52075.1 enolase [Cenarchaeum sp. SB0673_bin_9]MYJ27259.1 enolase [Cenarchaeum sp. SB0672_bin_9]
MTLITAVHGRIIYNSRGQPTIEVDVSTKTHTGRAAAPSGASVGKHEAVAFPKGGARRCLDILEDNRAKFIGVNSADQKAIYETLKSIDDTKDYSVIGGSTAFAVSMASAQAAALTGNTPLYKSITHKDNYRLPVPLGNILGGGAHAGQGAPDIQEILVCAPQSRSIRDAIQTNIDVHTQLGILLSKRDITFTRGRSDEGGWAPNMNNEQALEISARACEELGYTLGREVALGVDFAASTQYREEHNKYVYDRAGFENDAGEQIEFASDIIKRYKIKYAEDAVHEEAFEEMVTLTERFPDTLIVGDDLTVTNHAILQRAASQKSCNAAILKVNQAGSLYEAMEFARTATQNNIRLITSHRSGESNDSQITHVGVATDSVLLKAGILGGERVAKLNELLRISGNDLIRGVAEL